MITDKSEQFEDAESPNELLQPEILSKDALVTIFKQRKVEIPDLESLDHGTLVDLFYKNIIPLPQRKYRHNRRGRTATKQQIIASKRKRSYDDVKAVPESLKKASPNKQSDNARFICSYDIPSTGDRLKPPPSAINPDRKIIKLKSSSSSSNGSDKPHDTSKPFIINKLVFTNKPQGTSPTLVTQKVEDGNSVVSNKRTSSAETLMKVLPNKDTPNKPRTKIKLNRSSLSISSPEVSPATLQDNPKPDLKETVKISESTSEKDAEETNGEKKSNGKDTTDESGDEAVVRKKFKAVSVKWP